MARYILIDNCSGFIRGDTADVAGRELSLGSSDDDIIAACQAIDDDAGGQPRQYEIVSHSNPAALASNQTGYHVYRADVRGSEQVMVAENGRDQEMIDAVTNYCDLVAVVKCSRPE